MNVRVISEGCGTLRRPAGRDLPKGGRCNGSYWKSPGFRIYALAANSAGAPRIPAPCRRLLLCVKRSIVMDDYVLSVSDTRIKVNALSALASDIKVLSLQ